MRQVLIKAGRAIVADVPSPDVGVNNVLVQLAYSCVSVGTEVAGMRMSGLPLYQRALKQPDNVKRVLEMVRDQGLRRTMDRVSGKLTAGNATGYSAAGTVIAIGDEVEGFSIGDRVACAGAGIANHAEIIDVPVNLAVKLPGDLGFDHASTITLGAIAMQGVRRAEPTLGETFVVVGLGILGQLTAQILKANGCRVIGVDLDDGRVKIAEIGGLFKGVSPAAGDYVERVLALTDGLGADGVIVTAASSSDKIISEAFQACRKKGRVILVGDVGLSLNRADIYRKEIDFRISCSYGPGRYDETYEEGGQDYPFPYVRWTENRNMQAYLRLLSNGSIALDALSRETFPVTEAGAAYDALKGDGEKPLLVLLSYPQRAEAITERRVDLSVAKPKSGRIAVGLVGASGFAQGVHLPNMAALRKDFELRAVMSRTGTNAKAIASQNEGSYCTTRFADLLEDDDLDLVMITTRHDLHGSMVIEALAAGKHVFVEKPLALAENELADIQAFYASNSTAPLLMTGFNRRFSPAVRHIQHVLRGRATPLVVNYRMNAGFIPRDHWVHGAEGGGRNLGEACHIYDLFVALTGAAPTISVQAAAIDPNGGQWARNDNFIATIRFADGSICSLTYTSQGSKAFPKERMDIFVDGKVISLDDYKSVEIHGGKHRGWQASTAQKGQLQELEALAGCLIGGAPWPISLDEQLQASRIAIEVEQQISAQSMAQG